MPVSPSSKFSNNNINKNKQDDKEIIKETVANLKNVNHSNIFEDNLINNNKNNTENKNYSYENLQIEEIILE